MHHTGRVVSRTELVEHLYDQDFDRDSNTIEVFIGRIRKKLGVEIIQTVRGLGYLLTPRPMRSSSLALRLFLSATAWTVVILFATGACCRRFIATPSSVLSTVVSTSICKAWSPKSRP